MTSSVAAHTHQLVELHDATPQWNGSKSLDDIKQRFVGHQDGRDVHDAAARERREHRGRCESFQRPTRLQLVKMDVPPGSDAKKLRGNVKFLRNCFRKDIIGDRRSRSFLAFWKAVNIFAPTANASLEKPTSSRNTFELLPAFDFVQHLLHDDPVAMSCFLLNGTSAQTTAVPGLHDAVVKFLTVAGVIVPSTGTRTDVGVHDAMLDLDGVLVLVGWLVVSLSYDSRLG
jgi:hypothetical protein